MTSRNMPSSGMTVEDLKKMTALRTAGTPEHQVPMSQLQQPGNIVSTYQTANSQQLAHAGIQTYFFDSDKNDPVNPKGPKHLPGYYNSDVNQGSGAVSRQGGFPQVSQLNLQGLPPYHVQGFNANQHTQSQYERFPNENNQQKNGQVHIADGPYPRTIQQQQQTIPYDSVGGTVPGGRGESVGMHGMYGPVGNRDPRQQPQQHQHQHQHKWGSHQYDHYKPQIHTSQWDECSTPSTTRSSTPKSITSVGHQDVLQEHQSQSNGGNKPYIARHSEHGAQHSYSQPPGLLSQPHPNPHSNPSPNNPHARSQNDQNQMGRGCLSADELLTASESNFASMLGSSNTLFSTNKQRIQPLTHRPPHQLPSLDVGLSSPSVETPFEKGDKTSMYSSPSALAPGLLGPSPGNSLNSQLGNSSRPVSRPSSGGRSLGGLAGRGGSGLLMGSTMSPIDISPRPGTLAPVGAKVSPTIAPLPMTAPVAPLGQQSDLLSPRSASLATLQQLVTLGSLGQGSTGAPGLTLGPTTATNDSAATTLDNALVDCVADGGSVGSSGSRGGGGSGSAQLSINDSTLDQDRALFADPLPSQGEMYSHSNSLSTLQALPALYPITQSPVRQPAGPTSTDSLLANMRTVKLTSVYSESSVDSGSQTGVAKEMAEMVLHGGAASVDSDVVDSRSTNDSVKSAKTTISSLLCQKVSDALECDESTSANSQRSYGSDGSPTKKRGWFFQAGKFFSFGSNTRKQANDTEGDDIDMESFTEMSLDSLEATRSKSSQSGVRSSSSISALSTDSNRRNGKELSNKLSLKSIDEKRQIVEWEEKPPGD